MMCYAARGWVGAARLSAAALFVLLTGGAYAQDTPAIPAHSKVCDQNIVNKERLAEYLLLEYPVSIAAASKVGPISLSSQQQALAAILAAGPDLCSKDDCPKSDADNIGKIKAAIALLLAGVQKPAYAPTAGSGSIGPAAYLAGPSSDAAIICGSDANGPIEAPGATFVKPQKSKSPFRVRGNADDLTVDRSDKVAFAATKKANVSFADDHTAGSRTTNFIGYIGYSFLFDQTGGQWWQLIPYAGLNRNVVEVSDTSSVKPSRSSAAAVGALLSGYLPGSGMYGSQLGVRPQFVADHEDGSRLAMVNLSFVPTWNGGLNDFGRISDSSAWRKLILELKSDSGWYTERGIEKVQAQHRDFWRLGGKAGIAVSSTDPYVPLEFIATHTSLGAAAGHTIIDHSDVTLSWNFDPNKYFGLTLTYVHGRNEDTTKKEDSWGLGIGGRF